MALDAAIGIDVGGTGTKAAIVSRSGEVLARADRPTDPTSGTKGVLAIAEDLLLRTAAVDAVIMGIGVGAAGFVDASTGSVTFAPNLTYDDPQVAAALRSRFDIPVVVENDANAAAWGERAFGSARGFDHVALLTLGTGVGGGFVVAGRLVRGWRGAGAEIGHMVIQIDGAPCPCGRRGCLEQYASGGAIGRMAREAVEEDRMSSILDFAGSDEAITAEHVAKAARQFDETAREVLRTAGRALGIGLANVVNIFDPQVIVLSGSVIRAGEPYLGPARDELQRTMNAQRRRAQRLDVSALGAEAGVLGAAALAFDEAS